VTTAVNNASRIELGRTPAVVGTIITEEFLKGPALAGKLPCDWVELRLDGMQGFDGWLEAGKKIESNGTSVFATLRLSAEGGKWTRPDRERLPVLMKAAEELSGVDVELCSEIAAEVACAAKKHGTICVISYHDFNRTPEQTELEEIIRREREIGSVAKIAAMVNSPADVERLRALLQMDWKAPICVIGMGPLGSDTRISFAREGSCLTYGYLDTPGAPGQYSAEELMNRLGKAA
jgi:3-dehydroquinate dehydratase-1